MQTGFRIPYGAGCTTTSSGQHLIEFNEEGTEAWCCMCATQLDDLDRRRAFMALPVEQRRVMMQAGAEAFMDEE